MNDEGLRNKREYQKKYYQLHQDIIRAKSKEYYQSHREACKKYKNEYNREYFPRIKQLVLTHYGNGKLICVRCGFDNIKALSIDHINGGGNKHRKQINRTSSHKFYCWLKKQNFPEGYQTLCMNCQLIKKVDEGE